MVEYNCPLNGMPCPDGCQAAREVKRWVQDERATKRLFGDGDVSQGEVDRRMWQTVFPRIPLTAPREEAKAAVARKCARRGRP